MSTIWFMIVAVMVAIYVVLDGFDIGAGAVHLFIARTDDDRRSILRAVGPVWDGNEVWLITAGAAMFAAFPGWYAAVFSALYLPLLAILFGMILRSVSIEWLQA